MYKIALCGQANSGKNTTASIIEKELKNTYDYFHCETIAFADPIKKIIKLMFPSIKRKFLFGSSKFRNNVIEGAFDKNGNKLTIRQALIDVGSNLGRAYLDTIWLEAFNYKYNKIINNNYNAVIVPDLRFLNEFKFLKKKGFFIIKIKRNNINVIDHSSEKEQESIPLSEFDFLLDNNGNLDDLMKIVKLNLLPKIKDVQSLI